MHGLSARICSVLLILVCGSTLFSGSYTYDQNALAYSTAIMSMEEASTYNIQWSWDQHRITGLVQPDIVITNQTKAMIKGQITDGNGSSIYTYNDESVVMARFGYDGGNTGKWFIATRPVNGTFTIEIPDEYSDADYVRLWVNSNHFMIIPQAGDKDEYSYGELLTMWITEKNHFIIKPPIPEPENVPYWYFYQTHIDVFVNSAMLTYRLNF